MVDLQTILPFKNPPSVAVVGDICLDLYYFTNTEGAEVSVETGLQSFSVFKTREDLGGAGNVALNCAALGARTVDLYGLVGNDPWGKIVGDLARARGIGTSGIFTQNENWQTHVYHKIYSGKDELPRCDMGNRNIPDEAAADNIINLLESRLDSYQCVIINEQVPSGLHSAYFQKRLAALIAAAKDRVLWFCDCRKLNDRYAHTIRKLNIHEAAAILSGAGDFPAEDDSPVRAAGLLYKRWGLPVIITLGEDGVVYHDGSCRGINGLHFIREIDSVGAGDAFLAGLVTTLGAGFSLDDAALTGTFAAGVSLCKLGETGHPEPAELLALAGEGDFRYNPELARSPGRARYDESGEIEIVSPGALKQFGGRLRIAIFDHDGTISVLRHGWEGVMREVMIGAITGLYKRGRENGAPGQTDARETADVKAVVNSLIEKTTGVQTLAQMYALVELVRSFGKVAPDDILPPAEYKAIYNRKLLSAMEKRLEGVKTGRLLPEDVTIKGAVQFLAELAAEGVKLYLASGTDQDDVRREASLLGYAACFSGGIRGSLGDIKNDPKKLVIRQIIAENREAGGGIAVFGDGPVEMREAKKAGLLAVGVLSDEERRYGRNPDKRERLILAGADLLIPDFSFRDELRRLCGWETA